MRGYFGFDADRTPRKRPRPAKRPTLAQIRAKDRALAVKIAEMDRRERTQNGDTRL